MRPFPSTDFHFVTRHAKDEDLRADELWRISAENPCSYANYVRRTRLMDSPAYLSGGGQHAHRRLDFTFFAREFQTMYQRFNQIVNKRDRENIFGLGRSVKRVNLKKMEAARLKKEGLMENSSSSSASSGEELRRGGNIKHVI